MGVMFTKSTKWEYAIKGALIIGVPFILWSLFVYWTVYTAEDASMGGVLSFGVYMPAMILGFPWSLAILASTSFLVEMTNTPVVANSIANISLMLIIVTPMVNGALVGYRIGHKKACRGATKHNH